MIIIYCSKPQQNDAVTPTPLAHRSHTCMRALALGHDTHIRSGRLASLWTLDYNIVPLRHANTLWIIRFAVILCFLMTPVCPFPPKRLAVRSRLSTSFSL